MGRCSFVSNEWANPKSPAISHAAGDFASFDAESARYPPVRAILARERPRDLFSRWVTALQAAECRRMLVEQGGFFHFGYAHVPTEGLSETTAEGIGGSGLTMRNEDALGRRLARA